MPMAAQPQKKQLSLNQKYEWNLTEIFKDQKELDEAKAVFKKDLEKFDIGTSNLSKSGKDLYECLTLLNSLKMRLEKLSAYAYLKFSLDQSSIPNQELRDHMTALEVSFYEKISFVIPSLLMLGKDTIEKFRKEEPRLNMYKTYLESLLNSKPHVLDSSGEKLLASSFTVNQSLMNAYTNLKINDSKLPKIKDEEGKEVELTHASYQSIFRISPDRRVREDAHTAYFNAFYANKNTYSSLYDGLINFRIFQAKSRNYKDALTASTERDFKYIDSSIARNLIKTVDKNLAPFHKYFELKAKVLGLKKLQMWDVFAESKDKKPLKIPFEEARKKVQNAFEVFGNEYTKIIHEIFDHQWIDAFPRKSKNAGGFNVGIYSVHPYILLNYQDTLRDVEVLAHELGHAAHSYLTNKNQPYVYSDYTIFVAEIASITNEVILYQYLLLHEKDAKKKQEILYHYISGITSTLYRQTMFAEFEVRAHTLAENGQSINAESLGKIWVEILQKYYGKAVELDNLAQIYWAYIPHFFQSDFYVYQYATSMCAAIVLGEKIYKGDRALRDKYLTFLQQGSSKNSVELVKDLGIDLSKPEPIEHVLQTFEKLLNEYEKAIQI